MFENQVKELVEKIRTAETILIFGHKNPDGDSLGSALGLRHLIADNFGKTADIIYDGNLPFRYDFMPGRGDFIYSGKKELKKYALCICVDIADKNLNQFSDIQREFFNIASDTIKIDHHKSGESFAKLNIVKPDYVSTTEIIYEIAKSSNWRISADAAECLYVGILTDTGQFTHVDNGEPLRVAAELVDLGASPSEIVYNLGVCTKNDFLAQVKAASMAEFYHGGRLCIVPVSHDLYKKLDSGEVEILMKMREIKGVEYLCILKEAKPNEIRVSFRSNRMPVRQVAEKLGGGGHDRAAAANIYSDLESAKKIVAAEFAHPPC